MFVMFAFFKSPFGGNCPNVVHATIPRKFDSCLSAFGRKTQIKQTNKQQQQNYKEHLFNFIQFFNIQFSFLFFSSVTSGSSG